MTPSTGRHPTGRASGRSRAAAERVCATGRSEAKDAGGEHELRRQAKSRSRRRRACCATRRRREHRPGPEARPRQVTRIYLGPWTRRCRVGPRAGAGPKGRALHRSLGGVGERRRRPQVTKWRMDRPWYSCRRRPNSPPPGQAPQSEHRKARPPCTRPDRRPAEQSPADTRDRTRRHPSRNRQEPPSSEWSLRRRSTGTRQEREVAPNNPPTRPGRAAQSESVCGSPSPPRGERETKGQSEDPERK